MKALCALFFLVPAAFASILMEPVPVISTACTVGGQSVACAGQYGTDSVFAMASGSVVGLNSSTGLFVNAWADAESGSVNPGPLFLTLGSSAIASVSLDFFAATDGPQRQGFASFLLDTDGEHGFQVGATESMFVQGLGSCQGILCHSLGQLVPFQLGVPFEIGLSIFATSGSGQHEYNGGSGNAGLRLQLFEADGTPVTIFDPVGPVPEPGTWILLALGMVTLSAFRARAILGAARRALSR
jgi:hypothetical protein